MNYLNSSTAKTNLKLKFMSYFVISIVPVNGWSAICRHSDDQFRSNKRPRLERQDFYQTLDFKNPHAFFKHPHDILSQGPTPFHTPPWRVYLRNSAPSKAFPSHRIIARNESWYDDLTSHLPQHTKVCHILIPSSWGNFKNIYELLNLRALKI